MLSSTVGEWYGATWLLPRGTMTPIVSQQFPGPAREGVWVALQCRFASPAMTAFALVVASGARSAKLMSGAWMTFGTPKTAQ